MINYLNHLTNLKLFASFTEMCFNIYSVNSLREKDPNSFFNFMNLFLRGFNAPYLLFFN